VKHAFLEKTTLLAIIPVALLTAGLNRPVRADITVPGATDIWLAGQANGSSVTGLFGSDKAPAESPVDLLVTAGHTLTFAVSGTTSNNGVCTETSADAGNCAPDVSAFGAGPANGISGYKGPANALIGVFLNNNVPTGPGAPATLDFTGSNNFASLSPLLNQIFFIGDGLTGTGSGSVQDFIVPTGATRLFLASADALGASFDNTGSFDVKASDTSAVPEPVTIPIVAAAAVLIALRRK
jgi:hypothetical protein